MDKPCTDSYQNQRSAPGAEVESLATLLGTLIRYKKDKLDESDPNGPLRECLDANAEDRFTPSRDKLIQAADSEALMGLPHKVQGFQKATGFEVNSTVVA